MGQLALSRNKTVLTIKAYAFNGPHLTLPIVEYSTVITTFFKIRERVQLVPQFYSIKGIDALRWATLSELFAFLLEKSLL